jgi:hypothetical protein
MSKPKSEMRPEYRREDLGRAVRGKYLSRYERGTNLVLLDDEVAKAFPTAAAVNDALSGLLEIARHATSARARAPRKRAVG